MIHPGRRMNEVNPSSEVWRGTPLQSLTSVIHPGRRMNWIPDRVRDDLSLHCRPRPSVIAGPTRNLIRADE